MAAFRLKLEIDQGATFRQHMVWKADGVPVNMTDWTAALQVRADYDSPVLLELTTENGGITLGADGSVDFYISDAVTAALTWAEALFQCELYATNGDTLRKFVGSVKVSQEIVKVEP